MTQTEFAALVKEAKSLAEQISATLLKIHETATTARQRTGVLYAETALAELWEDLANLHG